MFIEQLDQGFRDKWYRCQGEVWEDVMPEWRELSLDPEQRRYVSEDDVS